MFDGYLTTDYEQRWEQKPSFVFIRALFDKFFYKTYMDRWKTNLIKDVNDLNDVDDLDDADDCCELDDVYNL